MADRLQSELGRQAKGAAGLEETLVALGEHRVEALLLREGFRGEGKGDDDVVEQALESALEQSAEIVVLPRTPARPRARLDRRGSAILNAMFTALATSIEFGGEHGPLIPHSRAGVALVLLGFIGSFGFIRDQSTRIMRSPRITWWPGSVTSGDVHLHHLVFGIVSMMLFGTLGFLLFDDSPWF